MVKRIGLGRVLKVGTSGVAAKMPPDAVAMLGKLTLYSWLERDEAGTLQLSHATEMSDTTEKDGDDAEQKKARKCFSLCVARLLQAAAAA